MAKKKQKLRKKLTATGKKKTTTIQRHFYIRSYSIHWYARIVCAYGVWRSDKEWCEMDKLRDNWSHSNISHLILWPVAFVLSLFSSLSVFLTRDIGRKFTVYERFMGTGGRQNIDSFCHEQQLVVSSTCIQTVSNVKFMCHTAKREGDC